MDAFLHNITTFPTAVWTTLLGVGLVYWLLVMIGMLDLDALSLDIDVDLDVDVDVDTDVPGVAGLMATLGLNGVPFPIVFTLLCLNAWLVCYFAVYFLMFGATGLTQWIIGIPILIGAGVASVPMTALLIRPLRKLFQKSIRQPIQVYAIGKQCLVRSSRVDESFGEAEFNYEGASIIIKVRTFPESPFNKGDTATIIQYTKESNSYFLSTNPNIEKV